MLSIKLFNSVVVKKGLITDVNLRLEETLPFGFILQPEVAASPDADKVIRYCQKQFVSGVQMNSTFHKSWAKIKQSTQAELRVHQVLHYFTTYGLKQLGLYSDDTIYIPSEVLEVPDAENLPLRVIKGVDKVELQYKALGLIESGVALQSETINDVLTLLEDLDYVFDSVDNVKNKEAKLILIDKYNLKPSNTTEFMRYLIYKATGETLIINDAPTLSAIRASGLDISELCLWYNLEELSTTFLRYKKLFMAFKMAHKNNKWVVNKLRRLAKKNHKPMPFDYLNNFVSMKHYDISTLNEELDKVNNFRKTRLLYALHDRMSYAQSVIYRIRNGRTFIKKETTKGYDLQDKFDAVYDHLIKSLNLKGLKVRYPENVDYVLPSTEKQFLGNFPLGTSINFDANAVVGIYWENRWGVSDYDLSSVALEKIGWNADFKNKGGSIMFSGDITNAPSGASECFHVRRSLDEPTLIVNNIYARNYGYEGTPKFRVFVAQENDSFSVNSNYMVDPNKVILQAETTSEQRQKVVGMFIPTETGVKFVITDFNAGNKHISYPDQLTERTRDYLFHSYKERISLKQVLEDAGCEFVTDESEEAELDLSVQNLDKSTILELFKKTKELVTT